MRILEVYAMIRGRSPKMFPFVASQAIALRQVKQRPTESRPTGADTNPQPRSARKGVFRRILDGLVEARLRKADLEIAAHRRRSGPATPR
jgi:hypothetical protein